MIYFNFSLVNPFCKDSSYRRMFIKNGGITKNKFWEIEFSRNPRTLFSIGFSLTFRQSHSGLTIEFGLLGYLFLFEISDSRHWDYVNNRWEGNE